ncbi:transposase [Streptomyces sp. or43]|nr:transposase [Streptomyces sp. or43]
MPGGLARVFLVLGDHGFGVAGPGRLDECGAYDVGHELLLRRGVREPLRVSTPVDTGVEENVSPVTRRGKTIAVNRRSRSRFTPVRSIARAGPDGPRTSSGRVRRRAGDREVLAADVFVATSGCTRRQLPPVFGPAWQTVCRRFVQWSTDGGPVRRPARTGSSSEDVALW